MGEMVARFLLGGAIVSVFSVIGEVWKPKTFSGIFGAAPAVAIATLALTFHQEGGVVAATKAWWMIAGAIALFAYAATCVLLARQRRLPIWLGACLAWIVWLVVAFDMYFAGRR